MQRFLHRSVARDTVRKHVLSLRAGAGRFGCFLHFLVMRISSRTKRRGSYGLAPPLCSGSRGGAVRARRQMFVLQPSLGTCESGACRVAVSFWVRSGTFFELLWDFYVRKVKQWDHISGSVSGLAFRRFLVAGSEGLVFCHQRSFVTAS